MKDGPEDDDPLWRRVKAQTRPLVRKQEHARQYTPTKSRKFQASARSEIARKAQPAPRKSTAVIPQEMSGHKRVRRGRLDIGWKTDLHGYSHDAARTRLLDDLLHCRATGIKSVLVITGKGKGILRDALQRWLREPEFVQMVSGYAQAHVRHGGAGAWYVFLRLPGRA